MPYRIVISKTKEINELSFKLYQLSAHNHFPDDTPEEYIPKRAQGSYWS